MWNLVLYFSLFTGSFFRVNRLSCSLGLKMLSLIKNRNVFVKSGNESHLRKPESFKNSWQITLIMNRLTKLIRIGGFILNSVYFISGNNTFIIWRNFRIYVLSWTTIAHWNCLFFKEGTQHSVIRFNEVQKNSGYPKTWKSYGYGSLVIEKKEFCSLLSWRRVGCRFLSKKLNIISSECVQLVRLRKVNFENKFYVNKNLVHIIANLDVLILAYKSIKNNLGDIILSCDNFTLNSSSTLYIKKISAEIKAGQFSFDYERKKFIPKFKNKSLDFISLRDRIVQKSIQIVLELIFEPSFLRNSHGFRPNYGVHTALRMIKSQFRGVIWVIENDISQCFGMIDHSVLLNLLRERISCDKTISLIHQELKISFNKFMEFRLDSSQRNILGPILCNIYLHELDKFLLQLKFNFDKGSLYYTKNPVFKTFRHKMFTSISCCDKSWEIYNLNFLSSNFRKLYFVRYADSFIIGVIGSFQEALEIKNIISKFLKNQLGLYNIKIKINRMKKKNTFFLGTIIRSNWGKEKLPTKTKITSLLSLNAPVKKIFEEAYLQGFFQKNGLNYKPTFVGKLINLDHANILNFYNSITQNVFSYYSFVDNQKSLKSWVYGMKFSCARTLALKYKVRYTSKIFKKYGNYLRCPVTNRKFYVPSFLTKT